MVFISSFILGIFNLLSGIQFVLCQVPPKLAPLPRELEFRRGERFQLVCSCREGDPPLTFSWVRDGQPLVESLQVAIRRFDEFSTSITIAAVREDHAGNYTCIVSNLGGADSSTVRFSVLVAPVWLRQPFDMSVLSGVRVTLNCETSGTPKPTVTWRRNKGFNLQQMEPLSANHWRTGDDGSLETSSIRKSDEGFYSCEATNGVGEGLKKTVRIEVQVPPSVWAPITLKTVKKSNKTSLSCQVSGDNPLTITWTKANMPFALGSEDRIRIEEEHSSDNTTALVIFDRTAAEDTGLYFCSARNSYGQSQATVRLMIVEKPSPPKEFRITEIWCRSVRVVWKQPYNGNSPIINYIIKYKMKTSSKATEMIVSDSQNSAVIQDLRPNTSYIFWMVAVNEIETSGETSEIAATTRVEEPESPPTEVFVKHKDSNSFILSWKPPPREKWNGDLLGFCIGFKRVTHGSSQSVPFTYNVLALNATPTNGLASPQEYEVAGLQESSSYTVVVHAFNKAGIGPPSEQILVKTTFGESPNIPSVSLISTLQSLVNLKIEIAGRKKAPLSLYVIHIREGSGHWLKIPLTPDRTTYSIGGLIPGAQYKLYVTSKNKFGDSGPSDVIAFRSEPESLTGSVFQYEEEDIAIPFFQRLSFIIPVAVSSTIILVVPIAACCCLQKLSSLPTRRTEGVESRGFSYTPAQSECPSRPETLPPCSSNNPSQGHYSTLQNYGSVIPPGDPRFSQFFEEAKRASLVIMPAKPVAC